jgi:hypothetical protein
LVIPVVEGSAWPANRRALLELQQGLRTVANLQRRGRRRHVVEDMPLIGAAAAQ